MIIDCHGHYTTAPKELQAYRDAQIAGLSDRSRAPEVARKGPVNISDDQIRESLENAQLKLQRERGTDLTLFSPRASAMGHHIGDATTSLQWTQVSKKMLLRIRSVSNGRFMSCARPR